MQYNSPVILTFFLLSLGVLFLGQYTGGWTTTHLFSVYRSSLKDPLFYIRLFGHVLGHGSWDHFLNNMLLLLVVGPPMEEKYGSLPLLKGILLTALISGILQCALFPRTALLGASGIVFMLIMLASLSGFSGGIPVTMLLVAALYLGQRGQLHAHRRRCLRHRVRLRQCGAAQEKKTRLRTSEFYHSRGFVACFLMGSALLYHLYKYFPSNFYKITKCSLSDGGCL